MGKLAGADHTDQRSENTPTLVDHSVDELAKGLASGTVSRRKALRLLGAALVGSALASIPGVAWAAKGGISECVRCCKETFGQGRERDQCISAGARGECPVTCDGNGGCPAVSCCCVCNYLVDGTTDEFVFVCSSTTTTTTFSECEQFCQSATPPAGTTYFVTGHSCESPEGFQRGCAPDGTCVWVECAPPAT